METDERIEHLLAGNRRYRESSDAALRERTAVHGQQPWAIVVACSDSRVIPEEIFSADLGELFVIRVAGNVLDNHQLGSIEYAAAHLGCSLVLVLGHTRCGAVRGRRGAARRERRLHPLYHRRDRRRHRRRARPASCVREKHPARGRARPARICRAPGDRSGHGARRGLRRAGRLGEVS